MTKVEDEGGVCGTKHSGGVELPGQSRNPFTEDADDPIDPVDDGEEEDELPAESRISKIFSENTTKTVIILILVNLFMQPLFMMETYITGETSFRAGLATLRDVYLRFGLGSEFDLCYEEYISYHEDLFTPLARIEVPGKPVWHQGDAISEMRLSEYETEVESISDNEQMLVFVSYRKFEEA